MECLLVNACMYVSVYIIWYTYTHMHYDDF